MIVVLREGTTCLFIVHLFRRWPFRERGIQPLIPLRRAAAVEPATAGFAGRFVVSRGYAVEDGSPALSCQGKSLPFNDQEAPHEKRLFR